MRFGIYSHNEKFGEKEVFECWKWFLVKLLLIEPTKKTGKRKKRIKRYNEMKSWNMLQSQPS